MELAPKKVELFTLPSEGWELDETTNNIEDVVEIAGSLYGQKRHGEALSLLTQLVVTLNNHSERDGWYSMFDDFNRMDDSEARDDMMDLFGKGVEIYRRMLQQFEPVTICDQFFFHPR